jgi:ribonuclease HI
VRATVYTGGKASKAKGASAVVSIVEGLPEGPVTVTRTFRPAHEKPTSVAIEALVQGIGVALAKGADELTVYTPSKAAMRSVDGTGGVDYPTARDAILAAWGVYWREDRCASLTIEDRPLKAMPEVEAAAVEALKRPAGDA